MDKERGGLAGQLFGVGDNADGRARVAGALVNAVDRMRGAGNEYASAVVEAASADQAWRQSHDYLTIVEDNARAEIVGNLTGKNEMERNAQLRYHMTNHPTVAACRIDVAKAQDDRDAAAATARAWDVRQKIARAEVAALTAILGG